MESNDLNVFLGVLAVVGPIIGFFAGAYTRGLSVQESLAELRADKEQINVWTMALAESVPSKALDVVNKGAQNIAELARLVVENQFINLPFEAQLESVAEVVQDAANTVEDLTDKTAEARG